MADRASKPRYLTLNKLLAMPVAATEQPVGTKVVAATATEAGSSRKRNAAGRDSCTLVLQSDDKVATEHFKIVQLTKSEPEDHDDMSITDISSSSSSSSSMDSSDSELVADIIKNYKVINNASKLANLEQHLQLQYRPFIHEIEVSCKLSLNELCSLLSHASYEPDYYPAVIVHMQCPHALVKIFSGGKIVAKGITANGASTAALRIVQELQQLGYNLSIKRSLQNMVNASFYVPFKIDLRKLCRKQAKYAYFNFDRRPFVTYTICDTQTLFAIFPNGYVLVMCSKLHSETREAIADILPVLRRFEYAAESTEVSCEDVMNQLLWEHKLEHDRSGDLLYSSV